VLSVGELALLGELTPQMFLRAWTAKEAVLKELGVGLGGLERCRIVALDGADVLRVVCDGVERTVRQLVEPQFVVSVSRADGAEPVWLTVHSPISSAAEEHG
jgi:phosphopantetheinyl transferase